jgi:SAM-dependent methyltransferase
MSETIALANESVRLGKESAWGQLLKDRSGFQREFVRLLQQTPQFQGRVLDIGCGSDLPHPLQCLKGKYGTLDGVDPSSEIAGHPLLQRRWSACFETSEAPDQAYDLAFAYNVLEHIEIPRPFFEKLGKVLKPRGVFWGLTPSAWHPFAWLSRSIELSGLKSFARAKIGRDATGAMAVNDYSAYYRCNSKNAINKAIHGLGFSRATYFYHPCLQWDTYFPKRLRWLPHAYDYLIGSRMTMGMQILIVRLDK